MRQELACSDPSFLGRFKALRFWVCLNRILLLQGRHGRRGPDQATGQQQAPKWCTWTLHSNSDLRFHVGWWCHVLGTERLVLTGLASAKAIRTQDSLGDNLENQRHWCVLWIFMQNVMTMARNVSWDGWALELWEFFLRYLAFLSIAPFGGMLTNTLWGYILNAALGLFIPCFLFFSVNQLLFFKIQIMKSLWLLSERCHTCFFCPR